MMEKLGIVDQKYWKYWFENTSIRRLPMHNVICFINQLSRLDKFYEDKTISDAIKFQLKLIRAFDSYQHSFDLMKLEDEK